jgi:hypothetical protein
MRRAIVSLLLIAGCAACFAQHAERIHPNFFGHFDLLSTSDREAILAVAHPRVSALMPGAQIISVKVFAGGAEVYVRFARDLAGPGGGLSLEKIKKNWKITSEQKPPKT